MTLLFCTVCWEPFRSHGTVPDECPICRKPTKWRAANVDEPSVPYELSENDQKFLKALKIDAGGS